MENEQVSITAIFDKFSPRFKIFASLFNFSVMITIDIVMIKYGYLYMQKFGNQLSMGMSIPMKYMYGIIPVGCFIALITMLFKLVEYLTDLKNKE